MVVLGLVLAVLAALLHVAIFAMESFAWTSPRALRVFRMTREQAEAQREMAFNQGFYNLFLAVVVGTGVALAASGAESVGLGLVLAGTGCMAAAAVVLFVSVRRLRGAAVRQGTVPLLAILALAIGTAV
ncbi:MAG: DUF1304 domain-containing protein [Phycicoccus sp.]